MTKTPPPDVTPRSAAGVEGKAVTRAAQAGNLPTTPGQVLQRNSSTRSRRLSYVTNDKDLADKIRAEYGDRCSEELGALEGAEGLPRAPTPARRAINLEVACMSRAGREPGYKKTNQDNCFAFEKYISEDESLFGAMDGHGPQGHLVSAFVKQHLPILLVDHLTSGSTAQRALSEGFLEVDARLGASRIDCEFSGSTCAVAYLRGNQLTTSWVGDSRVVLGRQTKANAWEAVDLSFDHKPTSPGEKERIVCSQGRVERLMDEVGQPMGPYRVWLQYAWVPGLAMSRALGDQLAHQVGVSSEPDHMHLELSPCDKFMVLASDGVWEFISSREAVELVASCKNVEDACRTLIDEAYQRWLVEEDGVVDDITAVVVRFIHNGDDSGPGAPMGGASNGNGSSSHGNMPSHSNDRAGGTSKTPTS